ncbi:hypothetical protein BDQ17DRAFT_1326442 [Cyathus striatus]|nr:hypothetical protein BDQ17DRAFT_1326442 [Cyathus striatus]
MSNAPTSLCPGYRHVDAFGPDDDYEDEELVQLRLIGLDSPTPFLQLSGTILKGRHDSLLGTELLFTEDKEQRICFKEVRLQPKRQASETMGGPEEGDEFMVVEPNPSASTEKIDRLTGKTVASTRAGRGGKKSGKVKGKKRQRDGNEEEEGYEEGPGTRPGLVLSSSSHTATSSPPPSASMPSAPPFAQSSSSHALFPALYLYPLNDSFIPKHISLAQGQRVKIGRQTNAKTAPGERNGFFDSKVLSRQHAEVWRKEEECIFIKDVKSSNGTFINGERLSPEAEESKPWELKSDDIVEFGIDIVGEDNKTIIHHKVAARVHASAGKERATFDHILSRLQGELQKSRETGAELNTLTNTMGEIHETLGGPCPTLFRPIPQPYLLFARLRHPLRPNNSPPIPLPSQHPAYPPLLFSPIFNHNSQIRALEGMLAEQETIKREMRILREMIEFRKESEDRKGKGRYEEEEHELEEESDDDDDARSVSTVIPHELERVDEVDEEQEEEHPSDRSAQSTSEHEQDQETEEQEHARRRGEAESAGRPHTPEPTNLGMSIRSNSNTSSGGRSGSPLSQVITAEEDRLSTLHDTVASLTNQVSSIVSFTSTLEAQHTVAQETIRTLEGKVESLELVLREVRAEQTRVAEAEESRLQLEEDRKIRLEDQVRSDAQEKESLTALVTTWKKSVEGQWSSIREEWAQERERLSKAREEWETKAKSVDVGMEKMNRFMDEQTQLHEVRVQILDGNRREKKEYLVEVKIKGSFTVPFTSYRKW